MIENLPHIRTPTSLLRPWREEDAPSLATYADNPCVAAALRDSFPSPYTLEDANRFIAYARWLSSGAGSGPFPGFPFFPSPGSLSGPSGTSSSEPSPFPSSSPGSPAGSSCRTPTDLLLAIEVDGVAAGGIAVTLLDDVYCRTAEIGYWLGEPFWGRGIMTDAIAAVVPVAFVRLDIVRIQAGVFANNPASMRVLEKCGFVREAVLRNAITKNGVLMDEVMHARFRDR
ncbi:GNAT family N-acetyltransferase [Methanogenium organophilum]|uniref:GNAT family protein n=1 Tax=Methanogenium organophilum TaxID=2199 RepID=A0A9X9S5P3_METOG|nr:GNAT family protein [Methanogenium organophilum]WAI02192.1 GNAT family protein [Methanogenium organophilum]